MLLRTVEAFKRLLIGRSVAYGRVFDPDSQFTAVVLRDLAKFCRAHDSTFHSDPRVHATLEGRREVWLRIERYLKLNPDELYQLHRVREPDQGE